MSKIPSQNVAARDFSLKLDQLNVQAELLRVSFPSAVLKCYPQVPYPSANPQGAILLSKTIDGPRFPVELQWCFRGKCILAMRWFNRRRWVAVADSSQNFGCKTPPLTELSA
jgi:hypothetical protein